MENFIKKVLAGKSDDNCHSYFVRFGKGDYKRRFLISLNRGAKIKVKASFEMANDLSRIAAEIGGGKVSGTVLSKRDISDVMSKNGIKGNSEEKRGGLFYKNNISEQELNGKQINALIDSAYFALLSAEGNGISLKIKQTLPKPGKDEEKINDKFCVLEIDGKYWPKIKEAFFWDVPESAKKAAIEHRLIIEEIELPKNEKDPAKMRELAIRKGRIVRKTIVDGNETLKEVPLSA